jgi:hypothetical protein
MIPTLRIRVLRVRDIGILLEVVQTVQIGALFSGLGSVTTRAPAGKSHNAKQCG